MPVSTESFSKRHPLPGFLMAAAGVPHHDAQAPVHRPAAQRPHVHHLQELHHPGAARPPLRQEQHGPGGERGRQTFWILDAE
ncbi:hypothetical protein CDAR_284301 [Caerostris darwini]|uniref:Uncharacterized protein n=1 Tax=Caerostris darwini TaxID=1538125 RepID=A0AAV4NM12_9ARAC|nr:hypothetical protein CDAR_284301 [Caerostris darwini]